MIIPASKVLCYLDRTVSIAVRDGDGTLCFTADFARVQDLVRREYVCGNVRGTRLRYLELIVPLAEAAQEHRIQRSSAGCKAQDSQTTYRGRDELALSYGHAFAACASYGGSAKAYRELATAGML